MSFCTQCGNSIEAEARFCGKCGSEIKKREINPGSLPPSNNSGVNSTLTNGGDLNRKKQKYNKKIIVGAIAIALIIGFYVMSPKQLTEEEYENLVIDLLVRDNLAMENFYNEMDYSGIYIGLEPDWSEDYKQLVKPAKTLQKDFSDIRETLEDVKPPAYFGYEHETLLKIFRAHQHMADDIAAFLANGDEAHMDSSEEYYDRAEEYMMESIFSTEEYEERLMRAYQQSEMD